MGTADVQVRRTAQIRLKAHGSASTGSVIFCCGKTAAVTLNQGYCSFFIVAAERIFGGNSPQTPTEYYLFDTDLVIRSKSETTVHCCGWHMP